MTTQLTDIKDIEGFKTFLSQLKTTLGKYGGRYFQIGNCQYKLNDIVKIFQKVASKNADINLNKALIGRIKFLDLEGNKKLEEGTICLTIMTFIRRIGNLFFNRNKVLDQIEFPGKILLTSREKPRYLKLKGEQGIIACRVRGEGSGRIPKFSPEKVLEGSTRTHLRLSNLIAVRGNAPGTRMKGPCDYFGNLEAPHKYKYTIEIDETGLPIFLRDKIENQNQEIPLDKKNADLPGTAIKVQWHKGSTKPTAKIHEKYREKGKPVVGGSLVPDSGILEVDASHIKLEPFDATKVDLSAFKARLVNNSIPFQITSEKLPSKDYYRAVTYQFESNYAKDQIENGGGVFLETHDFAQTMTPLDKSGAGFVMLAKWTDDVHTQLEVIGVEIPFGYTLIIEKDCIHGDATLSGMFMMCMTSDHTTMRTADSVFLKSTLTHKNVSVTLGDGEHRQLKGKAVAELADTLYHNDSAKVKAAFRRKLKKESVIFNPSIRV